MKITGKKVKNIKKLGKKSEMSKNRVKTVKNIEKPGKDCQNVEYTG